MKHCLWKLRLILSSFILVLTTGCHTGVIESAASQSIASFLNLVFSSIVNEIFLPTN